MTKEIGEILKSYSEAKKLGKKTALATVVKVEGSSYRQPGARMLVTEDGFLTGAISGGCLEGDALRKALLSIDQQKNKLITYNTSNEGEHEIGLQLGCNGIVHILFEFIDDEDAANPIILLQQLALERKGAVIGVVFSLNKRVSQLGTILYYREKDSFLSRNTIEVPLLGEIKQVLESRTSVVLNMLDQLHTEVLLDYIPASVLLVIAGAGNDVQPLVKIASLLGWEVIVMDGRATHASKSRFPEAKDVFVTKAEHFLDKAFSIDDQTFFILMTHNYQYDIAVLKLLLKTNTNYIGILGPKSKLNRMLDDLDNAGLKLNGDQLNRIYGPIGLDIGAETSEEIALSIITEIKAVMSDRRGTSLKYKTGSIHNKASII